MLVIPALPGEHNLKDYIRAREEFSFQSVEKEFSWSTTGRVNIVYEAVDRHVEDGYGQQVALYFEAGARREEYTFSRLQHESSRFAAVLKKYGLQKGDRLGIFMPRSPELYISFLGAARLGVVVVPLFEAFMAEALKDRLGDCQAVAVVTTPELFPRLPLAQLPALKHVFVVGEDIPAGTVDWHAEMSRVEGTPSMEWVGREHPLFILYASGADGRARGLVHVHNIMVGLLITARWVHDLRPDDIYWCTADPGWITGIAYGFLAPWLLRVPVVVRGGRFNAEDWCATLARYRVSVWYSAPTAFRMIMSAGDELLSRYDLSRLRHILSVGEPLTQEVMEWSLEKLGLPIYDTWWMSETGMNMICNYRCMPVKVGSIGLPFPGIEAAVVDDEGRELPPGRIGNLAIRAGWPAQFRAVWNDPARYEEYFRHRPWFISGDAAYRDEEGYFYFQGRLDGVINTSGERVGPAEVERKLEEHPAVARAGVAGKPDKLRGEIVKAYIVLNPGYTWSDELAGELREFVRTGLAAHAAPREFEVREAIPLTRDGRVDRRVLREWVLGLNRG
ncbi:acetyl-CoA synthetase [Desulfofundulus australicus DSM 11792]|jgi:acetyl-CoA synthetase|uniref:acetate--CoA ligase n=1 Tax=Desulfofundulus australicus DSM 11792 TaxID=1121425 RepID=A0A1M4Y7H4_9FIRM|nr:MULTISPECIES: acetate--CoA ligase [Desulfofundulus]MDK2888363.1 acetyl-CoA synthetase [Thermoanaerobacter sp.]SHF01665.1 acetyl-CoA synthetase [Desulfofundulus australicus DSM 11792]